MNNQLTIRTILVCALVAAGLHGAPARADELSVVTVEPAPRSLQGGPQGHVTVYFDRPVDRNTVVPGQSFSVFGRWSGTATGKLFFTGGDTAVTLDPVRRFSSGEQVRVDLSHDITGADGVPIRPGGYAYQFWVRAGTAEMDFNEIQRLSTRTTPAAATRAYGGIASDLDRDGFLDLTIVNEVTADLRVFMNRGDLTGTFDDFLQPPSPVNIQASPSEPADFNRDGFTDICVANIATHTVSILLGQGDGTYGPQQEIAVGQNPRGIAVLDVDGDGDIDVVNTNSGSSNMSLLLNDGTGVFGPATFFEGGGSGEWALAAADMNEDGLLDLVIGARDSQEVVISLANGDGTFTLASSRSAGGLVWMLVTGDLNGDGHEDVATANSTSNNAAILLGNGNAALGAPTVYPIDPFSLATDLGDLDGDGDLDWITSSFNGDWRLFRNIGSGTFSPIEEFIPSATASCALLLDADNDTDLDLALIDEVDDEIIIMENTGSPGYLPIPAASWPGKALGLIALIVLGPRLARIVKKRTCADAA